MRISFLLLLLSSLIVFCVVVAFVGGCWFEELRGELITGITLSLLLAV